MSSATRTRRRKRRSDAGRPRAPKVATPPALPDAADVPALDLSDLPGLPDAGLTATAAGDVGGAALASLEAQVAADRDDDPAAPAPDATSGAVPPHSPPPPMGEQTKRASSVAGASSAVAPARPAAPRAPVKTGGPGDRLTAREYEKESRAVLAGRLVERDARIVKLERELLTAAPLAAAARDELLETACAETFDTIAGAVAALLGVPDLALDAAEKARLGKVWAPIVPKYLGPEAVEHSPLAAALFATVSIGLGKFAAFKAHRAKHPATEAPSS